MTAYPSRLWLAALAVLLGSHALAGASSAAAQVTVLRVDPSAEPLCADIESALAEFGVAADPGYFAEAQRRGLDPASEEAMALLTPPLQVQLAIVPLASNARSVTVEFRDGPSGASLGRADISLRRGSLAARGQRVLAAEVQQRLAAANVAPPPPAEPVREADAAASDETDAAASDEADADGQTVDSAEVGLLGRVHAGIGVGMRELTWPEAGEMRAVESGAFLAVEVGAAFALALSDAVSLGPEFAYQTSLDHEIEETHIAGETQPMGLRAHRFEALLALTFRLGESRKFWIAPALGYGVRALHPEVHHLLTPSYSLTGPVARLTLRIPFGDMFALRLAPEVQLLSVGDALEELGVESSGIAFGGDAALELALSTHFATELAFRQAHAVMSSSLGADSTDVERFATLRLVWQP